MFSIKFDGNSCHRQFLIRAKKERNGFCNFEKYEGLDCKEKDSQGPTCKNPHL